MEAAAAAAALASPSASGPTSAAACAQAEAGAGPPPLAGCGGLAAVAGVGEAVGSYCAGAAAPYQHRTGAYNCVPIGRECIHSPCSRQG